MKIEFLENIWKEINTKKSRQAKDPDFAETLKKKVQENAADSRDSYVRAQEDPYLNYSDCQKNGKEAEDETESRTESNVIVKPDGSRVLVVTTEVGGMETTMSLKISEPTDLPNGNGNADNGNPAEAGEQEASEGNVK